MLNLFYMLGDSLRAFLSNNDTEEELRRLIAHLADSANEIGFEIQNPSRKYGGHNKNISEDNDLRAVTGTRNTYGDVQLKLDILADNIIRDRLLREESFGVFEIASEEQNEVFDVKSKRGHGGRYSVTVDPLDGSSLVDVNFSVGTIFGIYDGPIIDDRSARAKMVAAMYALYGPTTTLVLTAKQGTHEFKLD